MKRFCVIIILTTIGVASTMAQTIAVKTNLLYDATTTINLGLEAAIAPKWTIEIPVNYNPWQFSTNRLILAAGSKPDGPNFPMFEPKGGGSPITDPKQAKTLEVSNKFKHWMIQPEARYWFCEKFNGHFLGVHFLAAGYNIVGINTFGIGSLYGMGDVKNQKYIYPNTVDSKYLDYRYEGVAYGGGISYGYHWILSTHFSIEATLGLGYIYQDYNKYDCPVCGKQIESKKEGRFAPTKAGVSLIYVIK